MPRAFSDDDIVQSTPGSVFQSGAPISVTLGSATTAGHAGIIVLTCQNIMNPPEQWHLMAQSGAGGQASPQGGIACRVDLPAGETSWSFSPMSGSPGWAWVVQEWTNVSFAPIAATPAGNWAAGGSASYSTGSTGEFSGLYVMAIAYLGINSTGTTPFSAGSWSNGFVEQHVVETGDGTTAADLQLRVARRYGTPSDSGPWESTFTFTNGADATKSALSVGMAVFRAENHAGDI
jgi:hypothetical protein